MVAVLYPPGSGPLNPKKVIQRYCKGDDDAFRTFFDGQAPRLWRYLVARGAGPEDAYDLVAEAFARFVERVCRDPSSPVALLYRIAINLNTDRFRREEVARRHRESAAPGTAPGAADDHYAVRELLAMMEPDEQDLLLMRYWVGMTHREIAAALGAPEGTVRRKVAAALARLRAELG